MEKKKEKIHLRKIIFILFSLVFFFSFLLPTYSKFTNLKQKTKIYKKLKAEIYRYTKHINFETAYLIKDLEYPKLKISKNETELFPAASLIKLHILAVSFFAIENKKISLDTPILIEEKDITGGSGILKTKKLPLTLTFKELLSIMISNSDNTATNKIIEIFGIDYINKTFKEIGLKHTYLRRKMMDFSGRKRGVENYTTVLDVCYLLEEIYNSKLFNEYYSKLALEFLLDQKINDRLPKYLPDTIKVAHKTGLEKGVVHDAGIVFTTKGDYLICVFTKNVKKFKTAKDFIANLSKITYKYYQLF